MSMARLDFLYSFCFYCLTGAKTGYLGSRPLKATTGRLALTLLADL